MSRIHNSNFMQEGDKCSCGKICLGKKTAQTKANVLQKRGNTRFMRIYPCPESNLWHLSNGERGYEENAKRMKETRESTWNKKRHSNR